MQHIAKHIGRERNCTRYKRALVGYFFIFSEARETFARQWGARLLAALGNWQVLIDMFEMVF